MLCNNCGESGHLFRECTHDILSCGVILVRDSRCKDRKPTGPIPAQFQEVLMVRRRNSIGFVEFIRGKYEVDNMEYIRQLWSEMTGAEREAILAKHFDELWLLLWNFDIRPNKAAEKVASRAKFYSLDLHALHASVPLLWSEPEWGFPKGRKGQREGDVHCARRECFEETNVRPASYELLWREPLEERFQGSNGVWYRHRYFLGLSLELIEPSIATKSQQDEIGAIRWLDIASAICLLRTYQDYRLNLLLTVSQAVGSTTF